VHLRHALDPGVRQHGRVLVGGRTMRLKSKLVAVLFAAAAAVIAGALGAASAPSASHAAIAEGTKGAA